MIRDRTHIPCIGGQIPNHWTRREAPRRPSLQRQGAPIPATSQICSPGGYGTSQTLDPDHLCALISGSPDTLDSYQSHIFIQRRKLSRYHGSHSQASHQHPMVPKACISKGLIIVFFKSIQHDKSYPEAYSGEVKEVRRTREASPEGGAS